MGENKRQSGFVPFLVVIFPIVIDIVDFFLYDTLNQKLQHYLTHPSLTGSIVFLVIYFLFVLSYILLELLHTKKTETRIKPLFKKLGNEKRKHTNSDFLFAYSSIGFGIIMILLLFYTMGVAGDGEELSENTSYIIFMVGFVIFTLQVMALSMKPKPCFKRGSMGYALVFSLVVAICALCINVSVVAWQHLFGDLSQAQPYQEINGETILNFVLCLPLFLLFFSGPRFVFLTRKFSWPSFISALALICYFVFRSLAYVKIV